MVYLNIFLLAICIVIVTDISDFPTTIKKLVWRFLKPGVPYRDTYLHLVQCSFCQTFWAGVICAILMHNFSLLTVTYSLLMAYATPVINYVLHWVLDALNKLITVLYALIGEK